MSRTVLIVPDKFKGTLTAAEAAEAIARGWRKVNPRDELDLLPMSDGGDGFGEVMGAALGAKVQTIKTVDAAHRPCAAKWWWEPKSRTAIIESAKVIGLAMLPLGKFHPFELDTFGLGAVIRAAQEMKARKILIGIGGSATNDGGFGMARALDWMFITRNGDVIDRWTELHSLSTVVLSPEEWPRIVVAVDVQNFLLGMRGATRVYGPQKGIRPQDYVPAERALKKLAKMMHYISGKDSARIPGAGAAGGLGFGLFAFCDATSQSGFEIFAQHAKLERRLRRADLVITGEGAIDRQTLMGKGTGGVAVLCKKYKVQCIGLAGYVAPEGRRSKLFKQVGALTDLTSVEQAKKKAGKWLEKLAERFGMDLG